MDDYDIYKMNLLAHAIIELNEKAGHVIDPETEERIREAFRHIFSEEETDDKAPKISKKCYDDRCCHHMLSDTCGINCTLAQWPVYEVLTGSQCPYYTRKEEPEPGAFSERDRG